MCAVDRVKPNPTITAVVLKIQRNHLHADISVEAALRSEHTVVEDSQRSSNISEFTKVPQSHHHHNLHETDSFACHTKVDSEIESDGEAIPPRQSCSGHLNRNIDRETVKLPSSTVIKCEYFITSLTLWLVQTGV